MPVEPAEIRELFTESSMVAGADDFAALVGAFEHLDLADGAAVLEEGRPSDSLFVIASGRAVVSIEGSSHANILGVLTRGALVGEVSFLDLGPATATVRASGPLRLLRLRRAAFEEATAAHPVVGTAVLRALCVATSHRIGAIDASCEDVLHTLEPPPSAPEEKAPAGVLDYFRLFFQKLGA